MSNTTAGNGDTFIVSTDDVDQWGHYIEDEASQLIGPALADKYTLQGFQATFSTIKQTNFPDALQTTLGNFIQDQYNSYYDILQNRQAIGLVLQHRVASDSEVTEVMTKQQFQEQLTNIQGGSW